MPGSSCQLFSSKRLFCEKTLEIFSWELVIMAPVADKESQKLDVKKNEEKPEKNKMDKKAKEEPELVSMMGSLGVKRPNLKLY